jgi:hypothetical protein
MKLKICSRENSWHDGNLKTEKLWQSRKLQIWNKEKSSILGNAHMGSDTWSHLSLTTSPSHNKIIKL